MSQSLKEVRILKLPLEMAYKSEDEAPVSPAKRFLLQKIIHKSLLEALRSM
jgi:hypothetical protein